MITIDLVPHLDAGDRSTWRGDQNARPLSELGHRQAEAVCDALALEAVDAIYSSPALRCRQSVAPLAERLGIEIVALDALREALSFTSPIGWVQGPYGGAYAAGRMVSALERMRDAHDGGRVVVCSHGDVIPAAVAWLAGRHGLDVPELRRRGQWFRARFDGESVTVALREAT